MTMGGGQQRDERNPVRVGENVVLTPRLAAIGRVRSSVLPPRNARKDPLSTTTRVRSILPRRWSSVSSTACSRFQTPAFCHRTSRRQHVVPDPHPISCGSMFHGSPLRRTNRIPSARRGRGSASGRRIDGCVAAVCGGAVRSASTVRHRWRSWRCVTASLAVTRPYQDRVKRTSSNFATRS